MMTPAPDSAVKAAVAVLLLAAVQAAQWTATTTPAAPLEDVCGGAEGQVCRGCDAVAVCVALDGSSAPAVVSTTRCPAAKPFCEAGVCVAEMASGNECDIEPQPSADFRCPAGLTGYLPDPADCSQYHYCADGAAWDLACNVHPNDLYDHARAACVPDWIAEPCSPVICPAGGGRSYAHYAADNTVAFRCDNGTVSVLQCPANFRLDLDAGRDDEGQDPPCVRFCPRDGRQAHDDPSGSLYYECLRRGGALSQPVLTACPWGTHFDARQERCLLRPGVPDD